ncbi:MAG TPA: DNA repair protein RecO [Spirochaetota bacterium]|nr:DNA repair protein RecO [Spirochaetota bacterium]HRZ28932.1 DNA repair protein RecO [Spirochaetota bacterium]HSA15177.1 DNA repair protein RecO [Spirochaetota bacterium]
MEIRKTIGIILSARPSGEADVSCSVLTREYGKAKFIFKGLRKSRKRSHTAAEPGSVSSLQYYYNEEKESSIVSDFTIERYYPEIRQDLARIYHLYLMLETVDRTTGLNEPSVQIFDYLGAAMDRLSSTDHPAHLTAAFLLHFLKLGGLLEVTGACSNCGSRNYSRFSLDERDLRPVCSGCGGAGRLMPRETMDFIVEALNRKFSSIENDRYAKESILDLVYSLILFVENYYHIRIKSKEFILGEG